MSGGRRFYASWLLLVVFASVCLGVCTTVLVATGQKPACCAGFADGQASFTSCCATGEVSQASEVPPAVHAAVPVVEVARIAAHLPPLGSPISDSPPRPAPFRPADPQALLSTFLI